MTPEQLTEWFNRQAKEFQRRADEDRPLSKSPTDVWATATTANDCLALACRIAAGASNLRPASEYHEDFGAVLWWHYPFEEAPYVGSPLDTGWDDDDDEYYTHFTLIVEPTAAIKALIEERKPHD